MPEVLFGLGVREETEVRPVSVAEVQTTGGSVVAELNQKIIAGSTAATPDTDSGENLPVEPAEPAQNVITEVIADDPF